MGLRFISTRFLNVSRLIDVSNRETNVVHGQARIAKGRFQATSGGPKSPLLDSRKSCLVEVQSAKKSRDSFKRQESRCPSTPLNQIGAFPVTTRFLRTLSLGLLAGSAIVVASTAPARALLTSDPQTFGGTISPAFGPLATPVGTSYISSGLDFTLGNIEGIFDDGPFAFCGINSSGNCDLLTSVNARIVLPNTLTQGLTNYIFAEAGYAAPGSLSLIAYDALNQMLETQFFNPPTGVNGRYTAIINRSSPDIAYFYISGNDTFGVNVITIADPIAQGQTAPVPGPLPLLGAGMAFSFSRKLRRRIQVMPQK